MAIIGSDGGDELEELLNERLRTGHWPAEERRLLAMQQRAAILFELAGEAGDQLAAYRAKAAVKVGLRRDRHGNWTMPRARRGKTTRLRSARTRV